MAASNDLPDANHRVGIELAIVDQKLFEPGLALGIGGRVYGFHEGVHRPPTIFDVAQIVIAPPGHDGRQHILDAPTALLVGMVEMVLGDRQQVDQPRLDSLQRLAQRRQPLPELGEAGLLELQIVDEDRLHGAAGLNEAHGEFHRRVAAIQKQEGLVLKLAQFSNPMQAELKGYRALRCGAREIPG